MFFSHTSSILLFRNTRSSYYHAFISLVALTLILFLCISNVYSAQATMSWNPNNEGELAGYKVYYGNSSGSYSSSIDVGNQTSYTISNLVEGEIYFFAATAYDLAGNESGYSNEVSYDVPLEPMTEPVLLEIIGMNTLTWEGDGNEFVVSRNGNYYKTVYTNSVTIAKQRRYKRKVHIFAVKSIYGISPDFHVRFYGKRARKV